MRISLAIVVVVATSVLSGCATNVPAEALTLSPESLETRQLQTRRFDTTDESKLLTAVAGFLQDNGYTLDESEVALGVLVGSKDRDVTNAGEVILGVLFTGTWNKNEKIRASVITRPAEGGASLVRVTFQRIVWNTKNQITRAEPIEDAEIYQEFFTSLAKAVFLEAHQI